MNKKQLGIIIGIGLLSIIMIIGTSFAIFSKTLFGTKKVSFSTGTLKIDFNEGNAINLTNTAPMTDTQGLKTTPYTFTVKNAGTIKAYYTISFEESTDNTLNNWYVKYKLTSDKGYDSGVRTVGGFGKGTFEITEETELAVNEVVNYTLYLWLDNDAPNSVQGTTYKSKIVVNSRSNPTIAKEEGTLVADKLLAGVGENGAINTSDPEQTFITGTNPNNYIWYSGKLWRAVSIDPSDKSVKLVTEEGIASISYSDTNSSFAGSYMEQWLNDTTVDGYLSSYLSDGSSWWWWTLTPFDEASLWSVADTLYDVTADVSIFIRPTINLKATVKIASGDGTELNPYRLAGDNDTPTGTALLSTRYSGEYIRFGTGENNLYRIVSHENETGTKIVSNEPLKDSGLLREVAFGDTAEFSSSNTIGVFLNGEYLLNYMTAEQANMIENTSAWYLGNLSNDYKLIKYADKNMTELREFSNSKVGLLRLGEQLTGVADNQYWLLTFDLNERGNEVLVVDIEGSGSMFPSDTMGVRPTMNLKAGVKIIDGTGTKEDPFEISL